ncbi:hypothetical protein [Cupriavidus pinatubonensis]|uniref:Bacteriophage protein n=1 Tax=Cupriavidus pinatubonensis TaxID=248026 RepID=A0ABN7XS91_9BURK|nr:hypothetical protein [Cupriavidus pinatubonensis]CAG9163856.1 hypothetical protein LMG23994_00308 [Cupriavidus pinatubonensis]
MAQENSLRRNAGESRILSSLWTGLNPALLARFYPLKRLPSGNGWEQSRDVREVSSAEKFTVDDGYEVHCPITDGNSEMTLNWQSPFENTGPDSKAPALSGMLQSGSLNANLQAMVGAGGGEQSDVLAELQRAAGRTGITKLNSTQIFSGMPPVKLSMTLHFRALINPVAEVQAPIAQLKEWALPQFLADDGVIATAVKNSGKGGLSQTIFPSMAPQIVGLRYGDLTYEPLVIESVSEPITNPRSSDGVAVSCAVQVTLATLTALDRRDVQRIYSRG